MLASVINAVLIVIGSVLGMLFKNLLSEKLSNAITIGLGLCVALIGLTGAIGSNNTLCVILCMVVGIAIGEALKIEQRLDTLGNVLRDKLMKGKGGNRFTEGFMTATLMFCIGSMAIVGSMEAGINHDFTTIISKSVIDCITAITFAAAMGVGVAFSALSVLIYQGALTLLFIWIGPFLSEAVITEMSAVGGLLIVGLSLNMLGLTKKNPVRVGNMLPAIFLPMAYIPLANWISGLFA